MKRLLYVPACAPDLNQIEQAFAKRKTLPRKGSERPIEGV